MHPLRIEIQGSIVNSLSSNPLEFMAEDHYDLHYTNLGNAMPVRSRDTSKTEDKCPREVL